MAEYLTFVAATGDNPTSVEMRYEDENIWLTQKMMATLYDVEVNTINEHIKKIFSDNELNEDATIRKFRIVQNEGNRQVSREIALYNLQMIIAVGFKVNNERAVQFRKWANQSVKDYTIQGWVMDVERLKKGGSKQTALCRSRTDGGGSHFRPPDKENMGLTSWEGAPQGNIHKYDVVIAKNYLSEFELKQMERIVSAYLDMAEVQAMRHIPMTMADWEKRLNGFLTMWDHDILQDAGKVSAELAKQHAETEFEKYRIVQDRLFESDFDRFLELENLVKKK